MAKFSREIEVRGHLIDSLILTKIFDGVMDLGGEFEVLKIQIGKKKKDESYAELRIQGKNQNHLERILELVYREGATAKIQKEVSLKSASKNYVIPDNFYSTTNNHTLLFLNGNWATVDNMMMDKCIVVKSNKAKCTPIRDVKKGDTIVVGGPAIVHTGAADSVATLIRLCFINALLAGNALAVHDIEYSTLGTSLGINVNDGTLAVRGYRNHMQTINSVF